MGLDESCSYYQDGQDICVSTECGATFYDSYTTSSIVWNDVNFELNMSAFIVEGGDWEKWLAPADRFVTC